MDPDRILAWLHDVAALLESEVPEGWRLRVSAVFSPPNGGKLTRITFEVDANDVDMGNTPDEA